MKFNKHCNQIMGRIWQLFALHKLIYIYYFVLYGLTSIIRSYTWLVLVLKASLWARTSFYALYDWIRCFQLPVHYIIPYPLNRPFYAILPNALTTRTRTPIDGCIELYVKRPLNINGQRKSGNRPDFWGSLAFVAEPDLAPTPVMNLKWAYAT